MPRNTNLPIFVVDDDPAVLDALQFMLEGEGYRVVAFKNGNELLGVCLDTEPGCVRLDCVVPGMNGLKVYEKLRQCGVDAPVLLITGHPDPMIQKYAKEAGLPLVEKPLAQDLLKALKTANLKDRRGPSERHGITPAASGRLHWIKEECASGCSDGQAREAAMSTQDQLRDACNVLLRKCKPSVCCAIRENTPVPAFINPESWAYAYTLHRVADAPTGFQSRAAREATSLLGFYLFGEASA